MENKKGKDNGAKWAFYGTFAAAIITGIVALIVAGKLPFLSKNPETPFAGSWTGVDPYDNSIVTISIVQTGNSLTGIYDDTYSREVKPGYHGEGIGAVSSPSTANMTFDVMRGDQCRISYEVEMSYSGDEDTITMLDNFGYTTILKTK